MTKEFDLQKHVRTGELLTSSQLIHRCVEAGFDQTHARQLIRRSSPRQSIWRSEKLALQQNGRLFARREFVGTESFHKQLLPILKENRPGLYRIAQRLRMDEAVLKPHAELLLATPIERKKTTYPIYRDEVAAIEELRFGKTEASDTIGERIVIQSLVGSGNSAAISLKSQAALQIEIALTGILIDHYRRQNFISWNLIADTDRQLIAFNNYRFFAASFSWVAPLVRWENTKPKPTPVLFHVCAQACQIWDVEGFWARIERAGVNRTSRLQVLGIIAAPDFSHDAWKRAKEAGFLAINLRTFFGDAAFEAIVSVQELLKNVAGDPRKAEADEYAELSKILETSKTNPFIADLKSLAFEALVGLLVKYEGWDEVQLNLSVPFALPEGETTREVDVCGQRNGWDRVTIVECKAEKGTKPLDEEYVRKFFTETMPAFIKAKCKERNPSICNAEIWTTGTVSDAAMNALKEIKLPKFVQPSLIGREQIIKNLPRTLKSTDKLIQTIASL